MKAEGATPRRRFGRSLPWLQGETKITNLQTAEAAIHEAASAFPMVDVLWRGQADAAWKLKPRVFRNKRYARAESTMLWDFVLRGTSRLTSPPNPEAKVPWLQIAQHYGLPTRLLDWTLGMFVALFFVVQDKRKHERDGALWALDPEGLNEHSVKSKKLLVPYDNEPRELAHRAFAGLAAARDPAIIAMSALQSDLRMLVQSALFTIHDGPGDLWSIAPVRPVLRKFIVPAKAKPGLAALLTRLGITPGSLFPDLGSLAEELRGRAVTPFPEAPR